MLKESKDNAYDSKGNMRFENTLFYPDLINASCNYFLKLFLYLFGVNENGFRFIFNFKYI